MKKLLLLLVLIVNTALTRAQAPISQTIAGGFNHSLAICNNQTVRAWGQNVYGQLGDGTNNDSNIPVQVSGLNNVIAVSTRGNHSLALKSDGTVWAWGDNYFENLGNGTNTSSNVPVQVSALTGIIAIKGGSQHSLALKSDGTVWAWGANLDGQLGDGTNTTSNVPVQVSGLTGVVAIAPGGYHCLALKSNGTLWAWGDNVNGQLGDGTNTDSNIPVQISGITGIAALAAGSYHSLILKNDGTLWTCGYNQYGQLGNGNNTNSNVPVQVSGLTGITAIAGSVSHSVALKSDGTVWTWGSNINGQLGNGTNTDSNIPVQVSGLTGVSAIAAGGLQHTIALRSDGTVRSWGFNSYGQLGSGTNNSSNLPVQPTGLCSVILPCLPAQPGMVTGSTTPCSGSLQTYSIAAVTGATSYTWTLPAGWSGTSTTNSITATVGTAGGNITVAAVNSCGTSPVQTFTIPSVLSAPSATITQSGNTLSMAGSFTAYQWYLNGNPISGAINVTHTATQNGNYHVVVTGGNGCSGQSNTLTVTVVGVEELTADDGIHLYPNPMKDVLSISSKERIGIISIYDGLGRTVFEKNIAQREAQVDVSFLANGVYYLRTEDQKEARPDEPVGRGIRFIKE